MAHEELLFLVTDHKITQVEEIYPILEMIARESRPLVIVAEEAELAEHDSHDRVAVKINDFRL